MTKVVTSVTCTCSSLPQRCDSRLMWHGRHAVGVPEHAVPSLDLLGLRHRADGEGPSTRFDLPVTPRLCTPFGFLYGGSGIAASIEASERATGRPIQWITAQFLGSPTPGDDVEIAVDIAVSGRSTSQTRVTATVGNTSVISSLAAHNIRPDGDEQAFRPMPDVPAPADSAPFAELFERDVAGSFFDHFERRVAAGSFGRSADGTPQTGILALWCRIVGDTIGSAATQGFVADFGPLAVCAALGVAPGGTSLDNTLRVVDTRPTDWVLVEVEADGFSRSVGHSTARLWSEDGRLMSIAQQSAIIRTSHHRR